MGPTQLNGNQPIGSLAKIAQHRAIVEKRGLHAMGKALTPQAKRITLILLQFFACFTVVGIVIALPLYFLHYKKVAMNRIESDNILLIRERCLFNPSKGEIQSLNRQHLMKSGKFINDTADMIQLIKENHKRYSLAESVKLEGNKLPLCKYLIDGNSSKDVAVALKNSAKNFLSGSRSLPELSPEQFTAMSEVFEVCEKVRMAGGNLVSLFTFLDVIADEGKEISNITHEHLALFKDASDIYLALRQQEADNPAEMTLQVIPSLMKLHRSPGAEAAHQFAMRFAEHTYLRRALVENAAEFDLRLQTYLGDAHFNTTDEILEALDKFQKPFNNVKALENDLTEQFGKSNMGLLIKYLEMHEPLVGCGGRAYRYSQLAGQPFNEIVRTISPFIANSYGLSAQHTTRVLDADTVDPQVFDGRMKTLRRLQKFADELVDQNVEKRPLVKKFLELLNDHLIMEGEGGAAYRKNLSLLVEHGFSILKSSGYTPESIATGFYETLKQLAEGDSHDHPNAVKDLSDICGFTIFNREKVQQLQATLTLEVDTAAVAENSTPEGLEEHLPKLSKYLGIHIGIIPPLFAGINPETLRLKMRELHNLAAIYKNLCDNEKKCEMGLHFMLTLGFERVMELHHLPTTRALMKKIFDYGCSLNKEGPYSEKDIAYALDKAIREQSELHEQTYSEAAEAVCRAAGAIKENEETLQIKQKIQHFLLRSHVQTTAEQYFAQRNRLYNAPAKRFVTMIGERFIPDERLPTKATLLYVNKVVEHAMKLYLAGGVDPLSIVMALDGTREVRTIFFFKELNALASPKFSHRLKEVIRHSLRNHHEIHQAIQFDTEKMIFPLVFKLLPLILRRIVPPQRPDLLEKINAPLHRIERQFMNNRQLNVELKDGLRILNFTQPIMQTSPAMVEPLFATAIEFMQREVTAAINLVRQMNQPTVTVENIRGEFEKKNEVSSLMSKLIPNLIEELVDLNVKNRRINTLIRRGRTPLIITKGSKEETMIANRENAVIVTPLQEILMNILKKLPDNIDDVVKWIDKAPSLINGGGPLGRWFFNKIGTNLANKYIRDNLQLQPLHVDYLEKSTKDIVSIVLQLIPLLNHNHDVKKYFTKIRRIQTLVIKNLEVDVKALTLEVLGLVKLLIGDVEPYKPTIIGCLRDILRTAQKQPNSAMQSL